MTIQVREWFHLSPPGEDLQHPPSSVAASFFTTDFPSGNSSNSNKGGDADIDNVVHGCGHSNAGGYAGHPPKTRNYIASDLPDDDRNKNKNNGDNDNEEAVDGDDCNKSNANLEMNPTYGRNNRGDNTAATTATTATTREGALYLRLQLSLRDISSPITEEDLEASRALQTLLGEENSNPKGDGGDAGKGSASGATTVAGGETGGAGEGTGGVSIGGSSIALAKMLGVPIGLWGTLKDVLDVVNSLLDMLEVKKEGGGVFNCCCCSWLW